MEGPQADQQIEENSYDSESIGGESGLPLDPEKLEEASSSASSDAHKKSLSDANSKANDAAMNLKERLRSFSPSKRKASTEVKVKRTNSKKKRLSQMMSGASFKSKCILFKRIFKDLPQQESLIIDYSCALQRDILVHGRVYLSQNWLCFYANIFGWETLVTINWHEITAITKEKTARVIPNAIRISTSSEKYFFTSFVSRDSAYTSLFRIWQNALLGQAVSPLELRKLCRSFRKREVDHIDGYPIDKEVDETGDEVTENDNENQSISPSEVSHDNNADKTNDTKISVIPPTPPASEQGNIWQAQPENSVTDENNTNQKGDEDGDLSDVSSRPSSPLLRRAENLLAFARKKKKLKKKSSNNLKIHSLLPAAISDDDDSSDESNEVESPSGDVLCPCVGAHSGIEYCVEEFDFDVDALFEHLFSSDSDVMMRIHESRKMLNCNYHEFKKNEDGSSSRLVTYTLTLNYTIGPKHSETSVNEIFDKDNTPGSFYVVNTEVHNKGIPYAESFHVDSQYCLTRLAGNRCKMRIHSEVVYTKSVFAVAKNMIQRNADQAFRDYFKNLALLLTEKSDAIPASVQKKRKRKTLKQTSREDVPVVKAKSERLIQQTGAEILPDYKMESIDSLKTSYSNYSQISPIHGPKLFQAFAVLLLLLLGMNSYLFYRIYQLENFAISGKGQCLPKNFPVTDESWYNLLKTQKHAHELEIKRLKDVIGGTAKLVKQVEMSIYDLYSELEDSSKKLPELKDLRVEKKETETVISSAR